MALGDESPKILNRQPGVDERVGDSNPLNIDRAEPVRIAWLYNADFNQSLQSFEAHARPLGKFSVCQPVGFGVHFGALVLRPIGSLAELANHPDSGPEARPGGNDPDYRKADDRDRDERAQLSSQPFAGFVEAPSLHGHLLPNLIGAALSHFRAAS